MRKITVIYALLAILLGYAPLAQAETWNNDQAAAWKTVATSWEDEVARNGKWPAEYVHADVVSWGEDWPTPRSGDSMAKWQRFTEKTDKTLMYELFPEAIVVVANTAVVHYSSVMVNENHEGKRSREKQGLIETLVRDGNSWKFLSLTSFQIGGGD